MSMDYSIKKRLLSSVLEDIEICPYFQPIICLKTGKIFAYEALIRGWVVDTKEPISPSELFALSALIFRDNGICRIEDVLR